MASLLSACSNGEGVSGPPWRRVEWWATLAQQCNTKLARRCPRGKAHGGVRYESNVTREGWALVAHCPACGAFGHLVVCLRLGDPFLAPYGSKAVADMPGLQTILEEMG